MTEKEAQDNFGEYIKDAAFPQTVETSDKIFHTKGLTKREYFAAMAMQVLLRTEGLRPSLGKWSIEAADALIKALNESQP